MQNFLRTINDTKKINNAKKIISDESKKNIINTNEEKYEEEKIKELCKIKETLETRIINLQYRIKSIDIKYVLKDVKELEEKYLENKEEIIKMYGDEYKEKFNRLEKLIEQAYKKEEEKKERQRKRRLILTEYENELIEKLKYK